MRGNVRGTALIAAAWLAAAAPAWAQPATTPDPAVAPAVAPAPTAVAQVLERTGAGVRLVRSATLADLGYPAGLSFRGFEGVGSFTFAAPAGAVASATAASVEVAYSIMDGMRAGVTTALNGQPRRADALTLASGTLAFVLPVEDADVADGRIALDLSFSGVMTENRCFDDRLQGAAVTIRPQTGVRFEVDPARIVTVADAVSALPHRVTITLPASAVSADQYAAAAIAAQALSRAGHAVVFNRAPSLPLTGFDAEDLGALAAELDALAQGKGAAETPAGQAAFLLAADGGLGDILIGDPAGLMAARLQAVRALMTAHPQAGEQFGTLAAADRALGEAGAGEPALLFAGPRPVLALAGEQAAAAAGLVAAAVQARSGKRTPAATADRVSFGDGESGSLGLREISTRGEWALPVSWRDIPYGKSPDRVDLLLVAGEDASALPTLAHLFLDDTLLGSFRVDSKGDVSRLSARLPDGLLRLDSQVRLVLQRQAATGDCMVPPQPSPANLLSGSALHLRADVRVPAAFNELASYFQQGVTVFLPEDALRNPLATLPLVAEIARGLLPDAPLTAFRFADPAAAPDIAGPFVTIGFPAGGEMPVTPGGERLTVTDRQGRQLLDAAAGDAPLIAQIARVKTFSGLWIGPDAARAPGAGVAVDLDRGNVAFVDAQGVSLWLDAGAGDSPRIAFSADRDWQAVLGDYRVGAIAGAWLLLTAALIFAIARLRARRRDR